jgi:hypothetical protein
MRRTAANLPEPEKGSINGLLDLMRDAEGVPPKVAQVLARELVAVARDLTAYPRIKWERAHFVPTQARGAENIQQAKMPRDVDVEAYTYEQNGKLYGIAFIGKAQKPAWNYRFKDERQRDKKIQETIENRQRHLEEKEEEAKKRREFKHDLKIGDILYSSWGYDQTNIDFYEVIGVTEKSVVVRGVDQKIKKAERGADYVVAMPGRFTGPKMTKRVSQGDSIKISSYAIASKWDGKPKYQTAMGWGH